VKWAGLTGGIGCGKSTVATRLRARGVICIDVDQISRAVQQPGQPVFQAMVDRWGDRIVAPDGTIDREAVAAITFNDQAEMRTLMQLTSDAIEEIIGATVAEHAATDRVVLLESALMAPKLYGIDGIVTVDAPQDVAIQRMVEGRGMARDHVRARMANQASREQRLAVADFLIDNSGDEAALDEQVTRAWAWLVKLPPGTYRART